MKFKKKQKIWLYVLAAMALVVLLAYMAYTPANIMGIPFFTQAFAVIGPGETAYTGDTFQYIFTLTNRAGTTLPFSNSTYVVRLYKGYRMTDPVGTIVTTGCSTPDGSCNYIEEITTAMAPATTATVSVSFSITPSTPSSSAGNPYGVSAMLFKVEQVWNRATNTWTETPTIIDSVTQTPALGQKFSVKTQTPPPTPTTSSIMTWFTTLFASIWAAIKSLFGWT